MRALAYPIVAALALGVACRDAVSPASPTDVGRTNRNDDLATALSRSAQAGRLSGRVTDSVTGEPIRGARLRLEGVGSVTTDGHGGFTARLPASTTGTMAMTIGADGYWNRESHVSGLSAAAIEVKLFPDKEPFDLDFFDHVFRDMGARGTHPWTREPLFEIWTKVFDCAEMLETGICSELEATAQDVPGRFLELARDVILADAKRYTGGAVQGLEVIERAHQVGERIPHAEQSEIGKITFAMVQFPHSTSWARTWNFTRGDMSRAHIQMNKRHRDFRGIYSHELAHALGFRHPIGSENVPLPSIMRQAHGPEPTRHDILHGRLMYSRPPNSTSPDRDPSAFLLDALRAPTADPGPEVETVHP